jgi:glycerol-3-phosphate dehydrogenase subunit B
MPTADVVVIGAGLAGLSCAAELAERGARVFLAAKGMATTHWTHGGVDVAAPAGATTAHVGVRVLAAMTGHPYAIAHAEVAPALEAHAARLEAAGIGLTGTLDDALVEIPTAIGARRRASLLPEAQAAVLRPWADDGLLLVGIGRYRDAWPAYAARNLATGSWPDGPREIRAVEVDLAGLDGLHNLNARSLAERFDNAEWRGGALAAIARAVPAGTWRIGLPAVLGLRDHRAALLDARGVLGPGVFEIPSLPPSVPGLRLYEALRTAIGSAAGRIQVGFDVVDVERSGGRVIAISTEAASRALRIAADGFVLATGGIGGGGLRADAGGVIHERVFGLPVEAPPHDAWFSDDPLVPHPIEAVGIRTDAELRPIGAAGATELANVLVIGSALSGMRYLEERCGDGVALATAHRAARALALGRAAA